MKPKKRFNERGNSGLHDRGRENEWTERYRAVNVTEADAPSPATNEGL